MKAIGLGGIWLAILAGTPAFSAAAAITETGPEFGAVTVNFVHPEKFSDAIETSAAPGSVSQPVLRGLATIFAVLGKVYLAPGEHLTLDVTDVDLAGQLYPMSARQARVELEPMFDQTAVPEARWYSSITQPRLELSFVLSDASGKVLQRGTRVLFDPYALGGRYGRRLIPTQTKHSLGTEQFLIDDWLAREFKAVKGSS